jgi:hypothetical protein
MSYTFQLGADFARQLDAHDELTPFRDEFVIDDPDLIYLDGNSLGRMPKATVTRMRELVEDEWGKGLIRGWNRGWWTTPNRIGEKIARLIGAKPHEVIVSDSTSVNLFKLVVAALRMYDASRGRTRIVSDVFNFPSDLYILQGAIDLLGNRHELVLMPSADTVTIDANTIRTHVQEWLPLRHASRDATRARRWRIGVVGLVPFGRCGAHGAERLRRRHGNWLHVQISERRSWRACVSLRARRLAGEIESTDLGLDWAAQSVCV